MKKLISFLILLSLIALTSCSTVQKYEPDAQKVADYVNERSGFIENGIAELVRIAVAALPQGSDKQHYIGIAYGVTSNLNKLIVNGTIDSGAIGQAFEVNDPLLDPGLKIAADLIKLEIEQLKKNGYGDATIAILQAASKGVSDGLAQ